MKARPLHKGLFPFKFTKLDFVKSKLLDRSFKRSAAFFVASYSFDFWSTDA
jgi:hypothetical protein